MAFGDMNRIEPGTAQSLQHSIKLLRITRGQGFEREPQYVCRRLYADSMPSTTISKLAARMRPTSDLKRCKSNSVSPDDNGTLDASILIMSTRALVNTTRFAPSRCT